MNGLKDTGLLYISENMFIRISLFLESLLKYGLLEFEPFTDIYYDAMKKKEFIKPTKDSKIILNGKTVFIISKENKHRVFSCMDKEKYLKLKENL